MNRKILLIGFFILLISQICFSQTKNQPAFSFPENVGYVNDFEELFTEEQKAELESIIVQLENETTIEIAIVSITSYAPYENLFDYSLDLSNYWGVGKKGKNNGILLVFGMKVKQIRIQVGYGLEDKLTDEESKYIIDNIIIPEFRKGDVFNGIKKGLLEIINEIK